MDFAESEEERFRLERGDLLVCEGGEPGRAAVWNGQIAPCFYQKALHRVRVGAGIDPHFVMYRLWFGSVTGEFSEAHSKSTIAHLPAIRLVKLELRIPDLAEQQRIVAQLNEQMEASQRLQEEVERQVESLDVLPAALLRPAFSGEL